MKRNKTQIVEEYINIHIEEPPQKFVLPTGIDLIDCVLMGGIPVGAIVNIVGEESSGKSYLATEIIANAKLKLADKYNVIHKYDDAETGYTFDTKPIYGFDVVGEDDDASETVEEFALNLKREIAKLDDEQFLLYVLDSLDGLSSKDERKRDRKLMNALEKGEEPNGSYQMEKQKYLKSFFRVRSKEIKNKNCMLIILSQVIYNTSNMLFKTKYTRAGGKGLDHFSYAVLWMKEVKKIMKKGRKVGSVLKVQASKLKAKRPERECFVDLITDYGFDNISSNLKFLYDLRTESGDDKKKGSKKKSNIIWDDEEYSLDGMIRHIESHNLEAELTKRVKAKWAKIEGEISSEGRKSKW